MLPTKDKQTYVLQIDRLTHKRAQAGVYFQLIVPKMDLAPGQFVAVVGPSGCGKSTFLDILGLVLKPQAVQGFCIAGPNASIDLTGISQAKSL